MQRYFPLALVLLALSTCAWAAVIENASFEQSPFPGGSHGSGNAPGWTTYGGGLVGVNGAGTSTTFIGSVTPADGSKVAYVNGANGEQGYYQNVSGLTVGNWYRINLHAEADNNRKLSGNGRGVVSIADASGNTSSAAERIWTEAIDFRSGNADATMNAYTSRAFQATSSTMTLRVGGFAVASNALLFDSISVEEVAVTAPQARNASFENDLVSVHQYVNGLTVSGWSYGADNSAGYTPTTFMAVDQDAADGVQAGFIQRTGSIGQAIDGFTPGQEYTLSFAAIRRGGSQLNPLNVSLDGSAVLSGAAPDAGTDWTYFSVNFVASESELTLLFQGTVGGSDVSTSIDDVRFAVVPEPATLVLLTLGGLGALVRRRRA